ncbi:FkbM family methyltransferase [Ruegeria sp.]|uniref:FkbM family methyltransferase n=1 Tax=Ruegeria sp. TaxID=1879320 RepID=UPI003C7ABE99
MSRRLETLEQVINSFQARQLDRSEFLLQALRSTDRNISRDLKVLLDASRQMPTAHATLSDLRAALADSSRKPRRLPKLKDVFSEYSNVLEEGKPFKLWGYDVEYLDSKALWIQLNELIFRREYIFSHDFNAPHRIIDGGANIGLSVLFLKAIYPNAHIVAFEPNEVCWEVARRNIERNNLSNVTLLKAALGPECGSAKLYVSDTDSMAASLAPRRITDEMEHAAVDVPMKGLGAYLDSPVDFLKLDIEGNEAEVLAAVRDKLGNVRNLFCEYHFSAAQPDKNKLRDIIDVLDDTAFDFQVAKSLWFGEHSESAPMDFVGKDYSGVIYAKRRAGAMTDTVAPARKTND